MTTAVQVKSEPTSGPTPLRRRSNILPLTGVRAFAAGWVVAGHFRHEWVAFFPGLQILDPLFFAAGLGVDLFFALSGFILAYNYFEQFRTISTKPYLRFLGMRLGRVYPVHLFTLLILVAGVVLGRGAHFHFNAPERLTLPYFIQNLFLVHAWSPYTQVSWNGPAWSISAEWFAYLLFPFLALRVVKIRSNGVAIAGVLLPLAAVVFFGFYPAPTAVVHPLLRISCEFTAGVFLYRLYANRWAAGLPWSGIVTGLVATAGGVLLLFQWFGITGRDNMLAPLMVFLVFGLAHAQDGLASLLSLPIIVFCGEASYSLYMTHDLVRMATRKLLPPDVIHTRNWSTRLGALLLDLALIAVFALGTYLIVEKHGRRAIRGFLDRLIPDKKAIRPPEPVPAEVWA
jgi:peptidoglycan/LPS O-acetylase OafA/YrhL